MQKLFSLSGYSYLVALTVMFCVPVWSQESQHTDFSDFTPQTIGESSSFTQSLDSAPTNNSSSFETSSSNPIQLVSGPFTAPATAATSAAASTAVPQGIGTIDSALGNRIAQVSVGMGKIPQDHNQLWREWDITPYTKGRVFPPGAKPEQTIIDWIIRQTGVETWHSSPFSILYADSEKLIAYHTKEVMLAVADIVDRFVAPGFVNDMYQIRVISLSRPDWISRGHQYLRPIPIMSPGVQGWILEKQGKDLLLQELARRNDFKELAPPQFQIPNGVAHNVATKKQRTYLRDVQSNPAALNGYAEDRVTIEEGFAVSFVPLSMLDGQHIAASIKLDIVQIEKMIPLMIDAPTAANPRQRIQIETPQVSCFKLDEQIWWPKGKILLLDLGTIPLPNRAQQGTELSGFLGFTKNLGQSGRANILLLIEVLTGSSSPASSPSPMVGQGVEQSPSRSSIGSASPYWQGLR